jgi:hypothetical protein
MRTNGIDFSETFRSKTNGEHEEFYFGFYLGYDSIHTESYALDDREADNRRTRLYQGIGIRVNGELDGIHSGLL